MPLIGWTWYFLEIVFCKRKWEEDRDTVIRGLQRLSDYPEYMWVSALHQLSAGPRGLLHLSRRLRHADDSGPCGSPPATLWGRLRTCPPAPGQTQSPAGAGGTGRCPAEEDPGRLPVRHQSRASAAVVGKSLPHNEGDTCSARRQGSSSPG